MAATAAAPCRLRLVKYTAGETVFVLGTTLLDRKTYPAQDLRDLYLGRWGIEELYKISKQLMTVQDFPRPSWGAGSNRNSMPTSS